MLACVNCSSPISHDPTVGRLPPWCPHCGATLRLDGSRPLPTAPPPAIQEALAHWKGGRPDAPPVTPEAATGIVAVATPPVAQPLAPPVILAETTFETMPTLAPTTRPYRALLRAAGFFLVSGGLLAFLPGVSLWEPLLAGAVGIAFLAAWASLQKESLPWHG